jgi:hypothetical protein
MAGLDNNMTQTVAETLFPYPESSVWSLSMMILTFFAAILLLGTTPAPKAALLLLTRR